MMTGIVNNDKRVVIKTPSDAYRWAPLNFSAKITPVAAEGIAASSTSIFFSMGGILNWLNNIRIIRGKASNFNPLNKKREISLITFLSLTFAREPPIMSIERGNVKLPMLLRASDTGLGREIPISNKPRPMKEAIKPLFNILSHLIPGESLS